MKHRLQLAASLGDDLRASRVTLQLFIDHHQGDATLQDKTSAMPKTAPEKGLRASKKSGTI